MVEFADLLTDVTVVERTVNGQPGLVGIQNGTIVTVYAFAFAGDRITHLWAIRNPEKLKPWRGVPERP